MTLHGKKILGKKYKKGDTMTRFLYTIKILMFEYCRFWSQELDFEYVSTT